MIGFQQPRGIEKLLVKVNFLRISLVEPMSAKPENMKHLNLSESNSTRARVCHIMRKMSIPRAWVMGKDFPGRFHWCVQAALHRLYENGFGIYSFQSEQASFEVIPKCDFSVATDFPAFAKHVFMWLLPHFVDLSTSFFFSKNFPTFLWGLHNSPQTSF